MTTRIRAAAMCLTVWLAMAAGCQQAASQHQATPVYDKDTGKLTQLQSDTNGDGRPDTTAFMNGTLVARVEVDRDHDGQIDRWEHYAAQLGPSGEPQIERVDEANGPPGVITRREWYTDGLVTRIEDDPDGDGRPDKWELYERGALVRMDLDLAGRGRADRRLIYGAGGVVDRIEVDPEQRRQLQRLVPNRFSLGCIGGKLRGLLNERERPIPPSDIPVLHRLEQLFTG